MRKITNELIESFKNYLIEEEKSENTIEKYIRDITFFMTWLCGQEVTKILALEYKKELCEKYAPASVNAAISSLNSFFAFMEWHDIRIKALKIQKSSIKNLKKSTKHILCFLTKQKNKTMTLMAAKPVHKDLEVLVAVLVILAIWEIFSAPFSDDLSQASYFYKAVD